MNAEAALAVALHRAVQETSVDALVTNAHAERLLFDLLAVVPGALAEQGYYIAPIREAHTTPSRSSDPRTSHGAERALSPVKANTQRHILLKAYAYEYAALIGLTDEEAMEASVGVRASSEYAKRCSELREEGLIYDIGTERPGNSGVPRIVCKITAVGEAVLRRLSE